MLSSNFDSKISRNHHEIIDSKIRTNDSKI